MNIHALFPANEAPLDHLVSDGGFCKIFRTIACIGDSLSSGEFESYDENGQVGYHDMFEFSWGQYMARDCGSFVYNFSRGGMTASAYLDSFAEENDFWNPEKACQAYILALGVNDILNQHKELGTIADVTDNWQDNKRTFAGDYAAIIQRYKAIQPDGKFFLMTMLRTGDPAHDALCTAHADLLYELAAHFSNTYVLDFLRYAPVQDEEYRSLFYLSGHLNPCGYILTAQMVTSYIDYIVRHNMADFKQIGFIGTPFKNVKN